MNTAISSTDTGSAVNATKKLDARPHELFWEKGIEGGDDGQGRRSRQMIRLAPIRRAESGMTLSGLIAAMARRLVATSSFAMSDAIDYAVDLLGTLGEEFGSVDFDWSLEGAWEMVREDQEHWDRDDDGNG